MLRPFNRLFSMRAPSRRGLTLIEMLVATALTLLMMGAVVTIFDQFGRSVNDSRATIEMSGRLRDVRNTLQMDLDGMTTPPIPWLRPEAGVGYVEILEGRYNDYNPTGLAPAALDPTLSLLPTNDNPNLARGDFNPNNGLSGLGDADDILMMTIRSTGKPFVGRVLLPGNVVDIVESPIAEIIWYAVENPSGPYAGMRTLYRRVLLVLPSQQQGLLDRANSAGMSESQFYENFDVSARLGENNRWKLNTLADLTKRENRFSHDRVTFPYAMQSWYIRSTPGPANTLSEPLRPLGTTPVVDGSRRTGDDVVLTNVLAFDVRVFDPNAPVGINAGLAVSPGDPGWGATIGTPVAQGAFVDLGYAAGVAGASVLAGAARGQGGPYAYPSTLSNFYNVYDTWSFHYEHDGIDQFGDGNIDGATDGLNSVTDTNTAIDDIGERETQPPYDVPLRGIQITIRVYEPFSRQVREATVVRGFTQP